MFSTSKNPLSETEELAKVDLSKSIRGLFGMADQHVSANEYYWMCVISSCLLFGPRTVVPAA